MKEGDHFGVTDVGLHSQARHEFGSVHIYMYIYTCMWNT